MAGTNSWLNKAVNNPQVQAWYNRLKQDYPEDVGNKDLAQFIVTDMSGYDYSKAVNAGRFPEPQVADRGRYHWDDIGKTSKYYIKNTLPKGSMSMTAQFEGFRPTIYTDTTGNPTIGHGLNLRDKTVRSLLPTDVVAGKRPITPQESSLAMQAKYEEAVITARNFAGNAYYSMSPVQRASLVDMAYNMGPTTLSGFKDMKRALQKGDTNAVADAMVDSKWYKQVKGRAKYHEKVFRSSNPRVKALKGR